jgi:hypothetical protein
MTEKTPSERIRSLVDGEFKPPYIWGALTRINEYVISLEIQNEELRQRNEDLVAIVNWRSQAIAGDPPPFVQRAFDRETMRQLEGE